MKNGGSGIEKEVADVCQAPLAWSPLLQLDPLYSFRMRVLVVEDEAKMASFIKRGLEEEGSAVDVAADGQDGLFRASTANYDLIILDITLPLLDGLEVCRRLSEERVPIRRLL